jgi:hypothetical protein
MPDAAIFAAYAHDQAHEGAEDRGHVSVHPDRRLKFPDRGIARMADGVGRQAGPRLAAVAHDLKPAVTALRALADAGDGCAGPPKPSIRTDHVCPRRCTVYLTHGLYGAVPPVLFRRRSRLAHKSSTVTVGGRCPENAIWRVSATKVTRRVRHEHWLS